MFSKDLLAKKILSEELSYSELLSMSRSKDYPQFEVRTVGSVGTIEIRFPHQGWIKPKEWANNHATTIARNLISDVERLSDFGTPEHTLNTLGYFTTDQIVDFADSLFDNNELFKGLKVNDEGIRRCMWENYLDAVSKHFRHGEW
jgi:hypothetical protein